MKMGKSSFKKILFNFFEGKHTTFEGKMIEEWLETDEGKELYFEYLNEWENLNPQIIFDVEAKFSEFQEKLKQKSKSEKHITILPKSRHRNRFILKIAVGIALAFLIGNYVLGPSKIERENSSWYKKNVESVKMASGEIFEKQNLQERAVSLNLPDGSSVLLQPEAKISYNPKTFGQANREVILSGEAFFEVFKDKKSPFIVYANEVVAKVLGTSFTVKAKPGSNKAGVFVKSGKVSVFTQNDENKVEKIKGDDLKGLILLPSQKIEIDRENLPVLKPQSIEVNDLSEAIEQLTFNFEAARIEDVLKILEKAYNIEIVYDKRKLASAKLTAHLGDEPLNEKLRLISLALEATYIEIDDKIIILSSE